MYTECAIQKRIPKVVFHWQKEKVLLLLLSNMDGICVEKLDCVETTHFCQSGKWNVGGVMNIVDTSAF